MSQHPQPKRAWKKKKKARTAEKPSDFLTSHRPDLHKENKKATYFYKSCIIFVGRALTKHFSKVYLYFLCVFIDHSLHTAYYVLLFTSCLLVVLLVTILYFLIFRTSYYDSLLWITGCYYSFICLFLYLFMNLCLYFRCFIT